MEPGIYRLYSAAEVNFRLKSYSINKLEKISDKEYKVDVSEVRNLWNQVNGTWGSDIEQHLIFLVIKSDTQWQIDKYYYKDGTPDKYSGFSNVGKF